MASRTFMAYIEYDPDTRLYVGIVPGIPGAHVQGATLDELRTNLQDVVKLCIEEMGDEASDLPLFVGIQQIEVASWVGVLSFGRAAGLSPAGHPTRGRATTSLRFKPIWYESARCPLCGILILLDRTLLHTGVRFAVMMCVPDASPI